MVTEEEKRLVAEDCHIPARMRHGGVSIHIASCFCISYHALLFLMNLVHVGRPILRYYDNGISLFNEANVQLYTECEYD